MQNKLKVDQMKLDDKSFMPQQSHKKNIKVKWFREKLVILNKI